MHNTMHDTPITLQAQCAHGGGHTVAGSPKYTGGE